MARSVIGITAQGKMMLLTIDGAITGNADGATLEEAAFIAKTLGMKNAVCLADGSSSTLWTSGKGVVNHPVGNGQYSMLFYNTFIMFIKKCKAACRHIFFITIFG